MWTSGQWMTERTGGSDVEQSQTVAVPCKDSEYHYLIYGYKFFTSATTAGKFSFLIIFTIKNFNIGFVFFF